MLGIAEFERLGCRYWWGWEALFRMSWAIAERKRKKKTRRNEIPLGYSPMKSFVPRIKDRLRELVEHLGK